MHVNPFDLQQLQFRGFDLDNPQILAVISLMVAINLVCIALEQTHRTTSTVDGFTLVIGYLSDAVLRLPCEGNSEKGLVQALAFLKQREK